MYRDLEMNMNDVKKHLLEMQTGLDNTVRAALEEGKNEGWDLAKNLILLPADGGLTTEEKKQIFGDIPLYDIFKNHRGVEAEMCFKEWRGIDVSRSKNADTSVPAGDGANGIEAGDIVMVNMVGGGKRRAAVLSFSEDHTMAYVLYANSVPGITNVGTLTKTGKKATGKLALILGEISSQD